MYDNKGCDLIDYEDSDFNTIMASDISFTGKIHFTKPFMIPAKNPENDIRLLYSYNIPEFIKQPVEISKDKIADLFQ